MKIPKDWTFETHEVASKFDSHVREQLPFYPLATSAVAHIARHYIPKNGLVYDVGCSTGNIGRSISETIKSRNSTLIGLDPSKEMEKNYNAPGHFICSSAEHHDYEPFDLCIIFLTLMFIEPRKRKSLLIDLFQKCRPGGAIIVFDKFEAPCGYIGTILNRLALLGKYESGVSCEQIIEKELSLAGIQRPMNLMQMPGSPVQWFRFGNFCGYILEKGC